MHCWAACPLKEKVQVVLNQKGQFKCPNDICSAKVATPPKASPKTPSAASSKEERIKLVVANLKQRGNAKPRTLKTLKSSLATLFHKGLSEGEMADLVQQLQSLGKITVSEDKVTYAL
jgi:septum formation topological specificity factor MinE